MTEERWSETVAFARQLRRFPTGGEADLWNALHARKLAGVRFRRQHPIGPYIADFYAPQFRLVVEVDGPVHEREDCRVRDAARQAALEDNGLLVVRVRTAELETDLEGCLRKIQLALGERWFA
jgi:very-short-patch-repair endonuclease